ncbi:hypothetical protein KIPB_002919, partial [Kipferlia bialata]|eukprot:g2919.t1
MSTIPLCRVVQSVAAVPGAHDSLRPQSAQILPVCVCAAMLYSHPDTQRVKETR